MFKNINFHYKIWFMVFSTYILDLVEKLFNGWTTKIWSCHEKQLVSSKLNVNKRSCIKELTYYSIEKHFNKGIETTLNILLFLWCHPIVKDWIDVSNRLIIFQEDSFWWFGFLGTLLLRFHCISVRKMIF